MSRRDMFATDGIGMVDVALRSTGGSGASGDPWTGWDTAITWSGSAAYWFRPGYFQLASTLLLANNWTQLIGAGRGVSIILFAPTADDTMLEAHNGASELYGFTLRGVTLNTADSTYAKVGIDLVDCRHATLTDFQIGSSDSWTGGTGGSIGLRLRGRDRISLDRFHINADHPVSIAENPNNSIDLDHCTLRDYELNAVGYDYPCIQVGSTLYVSNVMSEGSGAWTKGSDGLSWVDGSAAATASLNLQLRGVRWEQSTNASGYLVRIEKHTEPLYGVVLQNVYGGLSTKGCKFRNVENVSFDDVRYIGTGEALDIDTTVNWFEWENCLWQAAGTATVTGQRRLLWMPKYPNTGPLPPTGVMDSTSNAAKEIETEGAWQGISNTLAADATLSLGGTVTQGFVQIIDNLGAGAIFYLRPGTSTVEVSDPISIYSDTKDNANTINVYFDTDTFYIQNKYLSGSDPQTIKVRFLLIGNRSDTF